MDDVPLRVVSTEEAQRITGQPSGADQETLELGRKIWDLALAGRNRDQIAQRLKIPIEVLDETLNAYRLRLGMSIDHYRMLDNERIDKIVSTWMPEATEGGNMKSAYLVIQAITTRIRILGATNALAEPGEAAGGLAGAKSYSERNITIWIRQCMPSIEKICREVDAEVLQGHENP